MAISNVSRLQSAPREEPRNLLCDEGDYQATLYNARDAVALVSEVLEIGDGPSIPVRGAAAIILQMAKEAIGHGIDQAECECREAKAGGAK